MYLSKIETDNFRSRSLSGTLSPSKWKNYNTKAKKYYNASVAENLKTLAKQMRDFFLIMKFQIIVCMPIALRNKF